MSQTVAPRPATAAQWARALDRALEEALDVLVELISGEPVLSRKGTGEFMMKPAMNQEA
jgi:hypothetical protein